MKGIINQFVVDPNFIFQSLANNSNDYIYIWDICNNGYKTSKNMTEDFHIATEGENFSEIWLPLIHKRDVDRAYERFKDTLKEGKTKISLEYQVINAKGHYIWISDKATIQYDEETHEPILIVSVLHNLAFDGKVDAVTGLLMHDKCQTVYELKQKNKIKINGSIMLLGIDGFTHINTLNDHSFGDLVLRKTVQDIFKFLDDQTRMYRFDGDQILIVSDEKNKEEMSKLYNRIKEYTRVSHKINDASYRFTISAGIVSYPDDGLTWQDLEKAVSIALKKAKEIGKNQCVSYTKEMLEEKIYEQSLSGLLADAIEHNFKGFRVVYQPVCSAQSLGVKGAEALLRFITPDNDIISPIQFIPLLEETQMIHAVGLWVLEQAIITCKNWLTYIEDFTMNVNVSYIQLHDTDFCDKLELLLKNYDLDISHLTVELTESYFITDAPNIKTTLRRLEELPLQVAMDDFGTGYSSLAQLSQFNVDVVKIDRSFIQSLHKSKYNSDFVDSVIRLCHNVGMKVCVEGVETEEEQRIICLLDADFIQGFYVSKPIDKYDFLNNFILKPNANDNLIVTPDAAFRHSQLVGDREVLLAMMDASPLALNFWNRDCEIIACNREVIRLFEAKDFDDFKNNFHTFSPKFQPDGQASNEKVITLINQVFDEERLTIEWMHCTRKGEKLPAQVTLVRIPYRGDYIVASYTHDLREQYAMQEKNIKFNMRLKAILDATPLCLNLWNQNFENTMCNREAVKLFSLANEEEYTKYFFELSPEYQPDGVPSNEKSVLKIKEAFEKGRTQFYWMHCNLKKEEIPAEITLVRIDNLDDSGEALVAGYTRDIRAQIQSQRVQRDASERIRAVLDSMPLACLLWNLDKELLDCNDVAVRMFGARNKTEIINNFDKFYPPTQPDGANSLEKKFIKFSEAITKGSCIFEWVYQNNNGQEVPCEVSLVKVSLEQGELIVAYSRDLRELHQTLELNDRLSKLAYYDLLTGSASRAKFMEKLEATFKNNSSNNELSLIIFDIDYFKTVNDSYGHASGDMVLKRVAKCIDGMIPDNAMLGRFGGDEFMIQMTGIDELHLLALMNKFVTEIANIRFHHEGVEFTTTISLGATFKSNKDSSYHIMLKRADKALYQAKENGRNCYSLLKS